MPVLKNCGALRHKKCQSDGQNEVYSNFWLIDNFRKLYNKVGGWHESSTFSTGDKYEWKFKLYVAGYDETVKDYIGIEANLKKKITQNHPKFCTVEFSIITEKEIRNTTKATIVTHNLQDEYSVNFPNFLTKNELLNSPDLLPGKYLNIHCRIIFEKLNADKESAAVHGHRKIQSQMFEKFFNNKKFSDSLIVVGSKEFHVHRLILAAQSPVFEAMFDSKMRESKEGKVQIDDIEPKVMEKLLRFVYVGEVDVKDLADRVLVAAEKYQLDSLKLLCEDTLKDTLNSANVYKTLQLADKYNATKLKNKAMEFFGENMKELSTETDFQASIGSLPVAIQTQIICLLAKKL